MNNKTISKQKQLSPQNYIRQKGRNLPILETLINSGWEENGLANIILARQHASGNITFCAYLVDTFCLGVKDSMYRFNITPSEYSAIKRNWLSNNSPLETIDYYIAHNIIYSAIEYAEIYGFEPCYEFSYITENFLEEDDDNVPLFEIECGGENGKPLYVNTGAESKSRQNQILQQLEKTAGKGNYNYILDANEYEKYFGDDDEEEDIEDDFIEDEDDIDEDATEDDEND